MTINELSVSSEEQNIFLSNGYSATIRFDMIYKRWFFDLYLGGELLYAGLTLTPDTAALAGISDLTLGLVDYSDDKEEYEPFNELGARLALMEIIK